MEYSVDEFDKLESAWKQLEKGTEMTCFQTYEWYRLLNKHFASEKMKAPFRKGAYILLSDDAQKPLVIAPVQIVKTGFHVGGIGIRKGFYFLGRQGFSDYLNFIYENVNRAYLNEVFQYLKQKYKMNLFFFENISEKTQSYRILTEDFHSEKTDSLCMALPLKDDFEEYKQSLSKNMRQNIRTAFNRSEKDHIQLSYEILHHIDADTADQLMAIREQRLGKKREEVNARLSKKVQLYNKARNALISISSKPLDVMHEVDPCWCFIARCNGEIGAFFFSLYKTENKTVYLLLAGVDKKYEWYSPGVTQLFRFIEDEINAGKSDVEIVDLTRGNEKYKYQLKSEEIVTSQFVFYL